MFSLFFLSLLLMVGAQKALAKEGSETSGQPSLKPLQCGVPSPPNSEGQVTSGQFPWLAAIYRLHEGKWTYICSGTLISTHIVLTAAHCLSLDGDEVKPEDIKVGLGKHNYHFESNETHSIIADVREVVVPDKFVGPFTSYAYDVALLDLAVSVKPTPHINPVCLLGEATTNINLDGRGYISGWSYNKNESQSLQVAFFYHVTCMQKLLNEYRRHLTPDKMCALLIGATKADSGLEGAALTYEVQGIHYVLGVLTTRLIRALYLLADMKNAGHVDWLQSEKSRLDALH